MVKEKLIVPSDEVRIRQSSDCPMAALSHRLCGFAAVSVKTSSALYFAVKIKITTKQKDRQNLSRNTYAAVYLEKYEEFFLSSSVLIVN